MINFVGFNSHKSFWTLGFFSGFMFSVLVLNVEEDGVFFWTLAFLFCYKEDGVPKIIFLECGENWACNRDLLIVLEPWMDIVGMQILAHYKLACVANAYEYDIIIGKLNSAMCL